MDKRRLRGTLLSRVSERRLESGALLPGSCDRMTGNSFSRRFMSHTGRKKGWSSTGTGASSTGRWVESHSLEGFKKQPDVELHCPADR